MISNQTKLALQRVLRRGIRMIGFDAAREFMLLSGRGMSKTRKKALTNPTMLTWRTGRLGRSLRDIGKSPDSYIRFNNYEGGVSAVFGTHIPYARPHENPNGWTTRGKKPRHIQSRPFLRPAYYKFIREGGWDKILTKGLRGTDIERYLIYDLKKYFATSFSAVIK